MLDSIAKLGEELLKESPNLFLESLVKYKEKPKDEGLLVRIIFDVKSRKIITDKLKLNRNRCKEYWWIGNTFKAAREPILRLTSDDLEYLLREGDGVDGILNTIEKFPTELRKKKTLENLYRHLKIIREKFKNLKKAVGKVEADLYTISIKFDGQEVDLAKTEGYKDFLEAILLCRHKTVRGTCYLCESESILVDPGFPSGSLLKMYVLDKKGFLSGISDSDLSKMRTFSVCPECLKKLLTGMGYIEGNLRSMVGDINLYLIPRSSVRIKSLERTLGYMKDKFDTVKSYEKLIDFNQRLGTLSDYIEHAENESSYTLNLIFGRREQASFSFYNEITEIPISSLTSFTNNTAYLIKRTSEILGHEEGLKIDFEKIYRIFPLSLKKTRQGLRLEGYSPLILLYSSLLHRHIYPEVELMKRALLFSRIHRYGLYGAYNIRPTKNADIEICYGIVKFNMLLRILKGDLNISSERHEIEISNEESITKYFELMKYEDWQKALFLLGYLVGQVGSKQYSKGDKKKSILSKINFNGMGMDKVMVLSNQILESLRNYRILHYNEELYSKMKQLLDTNLDKVEDPIKNTFYILSGYAFSTIKSIKVSSYGDDQNEW